MEFFGYNFTKKESKPKDLKTFDTTSDDDTSVLVEYSSSYAYSFESDILNAKDDDLIKMCREISTVSEVDQALIEIKNEIFIFDNLEKQAVTINLDKLENMASLKKKIEESYADVYRLLDFNKNGIDLFNNWYVDGRIVFHKIIETGKEKEGIKKLQRIDPLKIKRVKVLPKKDQKTGQFNVNEIKEFYVFRDKNTKDNNFSPTLQLTLDSITHVDSGVFEPVSGRVVSNLYKAIVPYNNLKLLEDSIVIYRVTRAPERRVFYVDTGNLPKVKGEQYLKDLMARFKNKLVYDSKTGSISDRKNVLSMVEDYWLPRREGGKGTEVTTLPGGQSLGIIEDIEYFKNKLADALNVPKSRFSAEPSMFGRGSEISRDEYRFKKFINKLRDRFTELFTDILKTQLILKGVISIDEWEEIKTFIRYDFAEDNTFVESKELDLINTKLQSMQTVDSMVGKYFDAKWALVNIMRLSEKDADEMLTRAKTYREENNNLGDEQ